MNNATEEQQALPEEIEMLTTKKVVFRYMCLEPEKGKAASPYSPL